MLRRWDTWDIMAGWWRIQLANEMEFKVVPRNKLHPFEFKKLPPMKFNAKARL